MMQEASSNPNISYTLKVVPLVGPPTTEDPGHPVTRIEDLELALRRLAEEETIVTLEVSPSIHGVNAIQGMSNFTNVGGFFRKRKMEMMWSLAIIKDGPKGSFETWVDNRIDAPGTFEEIYQFFYDFIECKEVVDPEAMNWCKM